MALIRACVICVMHLPLCKTACKIPVAKLGNFKNIYVLPSLLGVNGGKAYTIIIDANTMSIYYYAKRLTIRFLKIGRKDNSVGFHDTPNNPGYGANALDQKSPFKTIAIGFEINWRQLEEIIHKLRGGPCFLCRYRCAGLHFSMGSLTGPLNSLNVFKAI